MKAQYRELDQEPFDQLNMPPEQRHLLNQTVTHFIEQFECGIIDAPATHPPPSQSSIQQWQQPPPETTPCITSNDINELLSTIQATASTGLETAKGSHLSYIPNGGIHAAALGRYIAAKMNRWTGAALLCPGAVALEQGLIKWIASLLGFDENGAGVMLSGGSMANFTAMIAARARMGDRFDDAIVYVSLGAHHSIAKACRLAGLPQKNIRLISMDVHYRMDMKVLRAQLEEDVARGLRPMMIAATAGTTDLGAIDPLGKCASLSNEFDCWLHVDAAYGGFFALTARGSMMLSGIEQADSVTLDAHKSLFLPYGLGILIVADKERLIESNEGRGAYLQDATRRDDLPDFCSMGLELTRPQRGLDLWLPLHLHGVAAFRKELDRMLDLARNVAMQLRVIEGVKLIATPTLSIVCFRAEEGDALTRRILEHVNSSGEVHLSSSVVEQQFVLRLAFLNPRTTRDIANKAVSLIREAMKPEAIKPEAIKPGLRVNVESNR